MHKYEPLACLRKYPNQMNHEELTRQGKTCYRKRGKYSTVKSEDEAAKIDE